MKVYIFTEGDSKKGFGHVSRCLAISQAFEEKGIKPQFIINGNRSVAAILGRRKFVLSCWPQDYGKFLKKKPDIAVVDSYFAKKDFYFELADNTGIGIYVDDYKRLRYPQGIVVNGAVLAENLNYPKTKGGIYLLGYRYAYLRREFWKAASIKVKTEVKNILIVMGGSDYANLTPRVLRLLNKVFPKLGKTVIVGRGFKNRESIRKSSGGGTQLVYFPDAKGIKKAMLASDIAISAAGQTLYELARLGVPTVSVGVARNQLTNILGWNKLGFTEYAGWHNDRKLPDAIAKSVMSLWPYSIRKQRSLLGSRIIDGQGSRNIVKEVLARVS